MNRLRSYVLVGIGLIGGVASLVSMKPGPTRTILSSAFILLLIIGLASWLDDRFAIRNSLSILEAVKLLGIAQIHSRGQFARDLGDRLKSSKSISILSVSGINLISRHKPQIVAALVNNKAFVRVLLATPGSEFVEDTEEAESPTRAGMISRQIHEVEALLREYHAEALEVAGSNQVVGKLKLGKFRTQLRSSLIICDDKWGWLTLNLPPRRAIDSLSIEVVPVKSGLLEDLVGHFQMVWDQVESAGSVQEF